MDNYYNLEERTEKFAINTRKFIKALPKNLWNYEDSKQLVRSSGSVAANYIEANEGVSKKDYYYRVMICRKEVKESLLWLRIIDVQDNFDLINLQNDLLREADELMRIFGFIIRKHQQELKDCS